eukprot:gnl/Hemi2/18607_TR6156_c0_g1_i1.p1 gnl/Hemi2/18607_TR6156_c0_g1~~gnl/Hemi2/18607_TR6156_c0_g1_i1.p1  ORF type:complete len:288 (+),score=103.19 gnl/Hemi2/18607_TR6156_c0_g1_i1:58-921(+)
MEGQEQKGMDLMKKGDKAFNSFRLWNRSQRYEEAAEFYQHAANMFKIAKAWDKAANAFLKCVECHQKLSSKSDVAQDYINAAQCFKKANSSEMVNCYRFAIEIYLDMGRFSNAARYEKELAEHFEESLMFDDAIRHYSNAADHYNNSESSGTANQCKLKVAAFAAQKEDYDRAVQLYEQVAAESLPNPLLKWQARDHWLRAGICLLAKGELVGAKEAMAKYKEMDTGFGTYREGQLLQDIIDAVQDNNLDGFQNKLREYDQITQLDQWKITMLVRVRHTLTAAGDNL